jgi:spoIIIJ-associated protein
METIMKNEIITTAPTVEQAIKEALEQLGVEREAVEIEVLEEPAKKFFGDATNARVRVSLLFSTPDAPDAGRADEGEEDDEGETLDEEEVEEDDSPGDDEVFVEKEELEEEEEDSSDVGDEVSLEHEKNYNEALKQLTEEELDLIADTAIEAIRGFLGYFGADEAEVDEYEGEEGELILDIVGDNLAVLIGRHGKTLESLQFLVSSIVGKKTGYRHPIIIDIEGYKHRRKQKLISIAKSSAARAIRQKHEVHLRPMTPYERRIIHVALKNDKRIITRSEGNEPGRHIVIELT